MEPELEWTSRSEAETEALGEALGSALFGGALVLLDGELGAGKTCFARGVARGLDVRDEISSPTYALMQSYAGRLVLLHLDAWMEGRERAFLRDGGLEELDARSVALVEWGDRVADVLPAPRLRVRFEHSGPRARTIRARIEGAIGESWRRAFETWAARASGALER
jgi:tRNA threonylcarbamoyladenosine biosynthesis protein TsaE